MKIYEEERYCADLSSTIEHAVGIEQLKNSRILLTGTTGTIGSYLVDTLVWYNQNKKAGIRIYAAGRDVSRMQERFSQETDTGLTFLSYDMLQEIGFDEKIDYVIHAAGNAHPAAFCAHPTETIMGNVQGTFRLLEYARKQGAKRFLYVSSGEVYGQGDITLDSFEESYAGYVDINQARSCYPMSKRMTENLCSSYYSQYDFETVMVRPCHTYGPWMTASDSRANVQFLRNALAGKDIILKSSGTQMRSYCYVGDCASAILTVLTQGKAGESYNIANPQARCTIAALAEQIAKEAGTKVVFAEPDETERKRQTPIAKQVLNTKKLEALGWKGRYSVEMGMEHTFSILKNIS